MTALVNVAFAQAFDFARTIVAPYRNASGLLINAAIDAPRFDHDEAGNRRGLLIGRGPLRGQHDALSVVAGAWEIIGKATILFEWAEDDLIRSRALYSRSVRADVNSCLKIAGHLRMIGAVPGYLPNLGGYVRYRNRDWPLGVALDAGGGAVMGDGAGRVIIESA